MADPLQPDSNPPPDSTLQPGSSLQTWKLTLAYDGTDFQGWQVQPGLPTIQGQLQAALGRVTGESPLPQGSGRTDAGVHALAQVASFALRAPIPPGNLLRAVNRTLPPSIRISEAKNGAKHLSCAPFSDRQNLRIPYPARDRFSAFPLPAVPRPLRLRLPVAACARRAPGLRAPL